MAEIEKGEKLSLFQLGFEEVKSENGEFERKS